MTKEERHAGSERAPGRRPMAAWKKAMLVGSLVLMVIGGGLYAYGSIAEPGERPEAAPPAASEADRPPAEHRDGQPPGFLPDDRERPRLPRLPTPDDPDRDGEPAPGPGEAPPETERDPSAGAEPRPIDRWSPVIFTLGFSFFAGFCIGYAARMFLKLALILIGIALLGLFGLQYAGLIDVDWSAMAVGYEEVLAWLGEQTAGFRRFITGQLPAAALGALGLFAGFKR